MMCIPMCSQYPLTNICQNVRLLVVPTPWRLPKETANLTKPPSLDTTICTQSSASSFRICYGEIYICLYLHPSPKSPEWSGSAILRDILSRLLGILADQWIDSLKIATTAVRAVQPEDVGSCRSREVWRDEAPRHKSKLASETRHPASQSQMICSCQLWRHWCTKPNDLIPSASFHFLWNLHILHCQSPASIIFGIISCRSQWARWESLVPLRLQIALSATLPFESSPRHRKAIAQNPSH